MKNFILILLLCFSNSLFAEIKDIQGKNLKIYQELKEHDLNADSLLKIIPSLSIGTKEKPFFDYLLMLGYSNDGNLQKVDSMYTIALSEFLKSRNKVMEFEIKQSYASILNKYQKYDKAFDLLINSIRNIDSLQLKNNSKELEYIYALMIYDTAYNLTFTNNLNEADSFVQDAIKIYSKINDSTILAEPYNLSGLIYKRKGLTNKAIEQYKIAYDITNKTSNDQLSKIILNNISCLYNEINECDKAVYFARKMIKDYPEPEDLSVKSKIDYILTLNTLGVLLDNAKLHKNGIDTLKLATKTFNSKIPGGLQFLIYTNLAKSFNGNNQIDSASVYFNKALYFKKDSRHPENIANMDYLYGSFLADRLNQFENARHYLNEALTFYRKNPSEVYLKNLLALAKIEAIHFHNYAEAYELMSEAYSFDRNLQSDTYRKKLAGFEAEFKTKEKEIQIARLEAKQEKEKAKHQIQMICSTALVIIFLLLIIILFIFIRRRRTRFELKEAELKNELAKKEFKSKLLMQEMEHKLTEKYISGLEDSSKRMSKELHDGICNRMLSLEMELKDQIPSAYLSELISMRNEVRSLSHQLASPEFKTLSLSETLRLYIEKLSASNLFHVHFYSKDQQSGAFIYPNVELEIYRIFQETISNVIKHANASNVYITMNIDSDRIELIIEDDGIGFNTKKIRSGLGLKNINERIMNINGQWSISSTPGNGTIAHIIFPGSMQT